MIQTILTGAIPVALFLLGLVYVPDFILGVLGTFAILGVCFFVGAMIRDEVIR